MLLHTIFLLSHLLIIGSSGELVHLLAIWRHGDRAPSKLPYPMDIYDESYWPRGWNQLTNVGIRQTFELGEWFRRRYVEKLKVLNPKFNGKELKYKNTTHDVHYLQLPGCELHCPLMSFLEQLEPTRIRSEEDRKSLCSSAKQNFYATGLFIFLLILNL